MPSYDVARLVRGNPPKHVQTGSRRPVCPEDRAKALRAADRVLAKCRVDDDRLEDETTDDIVRMSRRRIVSSPETRGRAAYYRNVRSIPVDYDIKQLPLAVRGDRLAVIGVEAPRRTGTTAPSSGSRRPTPPAASATT